MEYFGILSDSVKNEIQDHYNGCRLCWAISHGGNRFPVNRVVYETESAVLIPGLGACAAGYMMLVSKEHIGSMAGLPFDKLERMERELAEIISFLKGHASSWLVFEHGVTRADASGGATIDHLHLHLIPLEFDLLSRAAKTLNQTPVEVSSLRGLRDAAMANRANYVFIRDANGSSHAIFTNDCPSQFLRRIIADHVDKGHAWNWKERPMEENSLHTLRDLKMSGLVSPDIYFVHSIEGRKRETVQADVDKYRDLLREHEVKATLCSMFEIFEQRFFSEGYFRGENFPKLLVETEKRIIRSCEIVLADLSIPGHQYVGAIMEIMYAYDLGIPVVAVAGAGPIGTRLWLKAHCDRIVGTPEEAVQCLEPLIDKRMGSV
jgi:diadenosine tetraphosphate (Ap4A) HIT family hydrolase